MEHQVLALGKSDRVLAQQMDRAARADAGDPALDRVRIDALRLLAFQAQHDGPVGSVSAPGRTERSVQLNLHRARGREQSGFAQAEGELARRAHRPHRVRAGRPDADPEQL